MDIRTPVESTDPELTKARTRKPAEADLERDDDELDEAAARQEELLDEGVEETFPASDPVSVKRIT